jgi:phosphatidylglycerophosphatase A
MAMAWALIRVLSWHQAHFAVFAILTGAIGVWAAEHATAAFGNADPKEVVVDEVAGSWFTLAGAVTLNGCALAEAFVLFRIFDIWKPYPIRRLERLHGGIGIVADDLMAGVCAALVLFLAGCLNLY